MKSKKGQIFLVAALILIVVVSSIFLYQNRIRTSSDDKLISFKKQLSEESAFVMDYGVYNREDKLNEFLGQFSSDLLVVNPEIKMVFFFGNKTHIKVLNLANETIKFVLAGREENIPSVPRENFINIGGSGVSFINLQDTLVQSYIQTFPFPSIQEKINFKIEEINYEIHLDKYKNFYFLIKREGGDEKNVVIG